MSENPAGNFFSTYMMDIRKKAITNRLNIKEPFLPNELKIFSIKTSEAFLMLDSCNAIPTSYKTNKGRMNKKTIGYIFLSDGNTIPCTCITFVIKRGTNRPHLFLMQNVKRVV
ncbi:MAG: hypothetical protein AYP45_09480 [Candidatus Brocadia carolinensis]|uniref:Uncharacterized protein n=1 Tax=Candidatus Brocadia carolinensis TaxID=1004156 RepID=A0A1V4AT82_9BACT|nr:MAG: hypothetical protein AYP45_09480 [Candidatus Brocadia caroliniensis]